MRRSVTVTAILLSAALALPARAEISGREVGQILGGLATLYVLKEALERDGRRAERDRPQVRRHAPPPVYRYRVERPRNRGFAIGPPPRTYPGHDRFRPHRPDRRALRVVPEHCARPYRDGRGHGVGYGARCMWNSVGRPGLLPDDCLRRVHTHRGPRHVYSQGCLRRWGWATGRRH